MTCLPSLVKNLVFCRWKTWKVNGFIQDKKNTTKWWINIWKSNTLSRMFTIHIKYMKIFFYTFNNNDNWLHTKIELQPRQKKDWYKNPQFWQRVFFIVYLLKKALSIKWCIRLFIKHLKDGRPELKSLSKSVKPFFNN